jgi:hypothetical protein
MKATLIKANLWDKESHGIILKEIIENCPCVLARKPHPPPRVSLTSVERGDELCIDTVYFLGVPHLHAEDKYSAFSQCVKLPDRSISTQIKMLNDMWIQPYGVPKKILADTEYDKPSFKHFCNSIGSVLVTIATEAHHQNGVIESGNRILRMFFNRIRIAEKQFDMKQVVEQAVYGKNCCTGSKSSTSYELWFGYGPSPSTILSSMKTAFVAKQARAKVYRALKNGYRSRTEVETGQYVRFYREKTGWSSPCLVVSVSHNIITVVHNNVLKTAARSNVMPSDPPFSALLDTGNTEFDFNERYANSEQNNDLAINDGITTVPENVSPRASAARINSADNDKERDDISETAEHSGCQDEKSSINCSTGMTLRSAKTFQKSTQNDYDQNLVTFGDTHFVTTMPFTNSSKLARPEEMAESYLVEKENWNKSGAYTLVKISDVPQSANIISSHVIYKWKTSGTLKARIVPHGRMMKRVFYEQMPLRCL